MGNMLRRCRGWDYRERCIYLVTLTAENRLPVFGRLVGGEADARIELTAIGQLVLDCWQELPLHYPGVELLEWQVMPEHFHGIVFVKERQVRPLGAMIGSFKAHSTSLLKQAASGLPQNGAGALPTEPQMPAASGWLQDGGGALPLPPGPQNSWRQGERLCAEARQVLFRAACGTAEGSFRLWSPGFHDTILFHQGQLANMRAYIRDNPRRLAVKRAHPELFRVVRSIPLCGTSFAGIGNHFLLQAPVRIAVQCSRSITATALAQQQLELLAAARHAAVLISPCISPGEKQIARAALAARAYLIVLLENGFPELYKPPKTYFEACCAGLLLLLAPWPYHTDKQLITREQCLVLNAYTRQLAKVETV